MNLSSMTSFIFQLIEAEFFAPEYIKYEFQEHKDECWIKSKLSKEDFEKRQQEIFKSLKLIKLSKYKKFLKQSAEVLLDKDDMPYLALALSIKAHIWSNDRKLKEQHLAHVFNTKDIFNTFFG